MILETLPKSLYSNSNIEIFMNNKNSAIIHKILNENLVDKKMYLSSLALVYITSGEQIIRNKEGNVTRISEGNMLLLKKDRYLVSDFVTKSSVFEAIIFFLDDDVIEKYALSKNSQQGSDGENKSISIIKTNQQILGFIKSIPFVYKNSANDPILLELKLLELLHLISLESENNDILLSLNSLSKRRNIKKFMEENYLSNLNIKDYAVLTGRSVNLPSLVPIQIRIFLFKICFFVTHGRLIIQCLMRPFIVVLLNPFFSDLSYLSERMKDIEVQYFCSISPVKTFHIGILCRRPWLNKLKVYTMVFCPLRESQ